MIDNQEIEKRLASALDAAAPDILDDLMAELQLNEEPEPTMREMLADDDQAVYKKAAVRGRSFRALISIAAAFILMVGGTAVWKNINNTVLAVVDLDVNPSVELSINSKEKIIEAKPVNDEGVKILEDMDLKGADVKVACNAIVGSMMMKGYLNDRSNSILLSVSSDDSAKGHEIEEQLAGYINTHMGESSIAASVHGQYVDGDDELREFASRNGISIGKAWLIRRLLESGASKMTEESLLSLTTQELIVLSQERNMESDTVYGKAYTGEYVGTEGAVDAALSDAGLERSQVTGIEVEMDCENGVIVYEVEFNHNGREYDYEIIASTGKVSYSNQESDDDDDYDYDDDDDDDDYDDDDYDDDDDDRYDYDYDDDDDDRYERDDDDDDDDDD